MLQNIFITFEVESKSFPEYFLKWKYWMIYFRHNVKGKHILLPFSLLLFSAPTENTHCDQCICWTEYLKINDCVHARIYLQVIWSWDNSIISDYEMEDWASMLGRGVDFSLGHQTSNSSVARSKFYPTILSIFAFILCLYLQYNYAINV